MPSKTSGNEKVEMKDIKEQISVQTPVKVNLVDAKSQTPHVTQKTKLDNKDKNVSLCNYHKKSESTEKLSDQNDGHNKTKIFNNIEACNFPNNIHPSNIKTLSSNGNNVNNVSNETETNLNSSFVNSSTVSGNKDNRSPNPITIFKADYPFFETTL